MKVLVAFDGTLSAREALRHGITKVREKGGELHAMHVFNRDAITDYDATIWTVDKIRRETDRIISDGEHMLREEAQGVKSFMITCEGNPEHEIVDYVKTEQVDLLLCPQSLKSIVNKYSKALVERGLAEPADAQSVAQAVK